MEQEVKARINQLGIGPGGVGGKTTALAVKIGLAYTHTAICPVAVNFHCWVGRRFGFRFYSDGKMEEIL
jgi:fumarate hydratase subunit alpha